MEVALEEREARSAIERKPADSVEVEVRNLPVAKIRRGSVGEASGVREVTHSKVEPEVEPQGHAR